MKTNLLPAKKERQEPREALGASPKSPSVYIGLIEEIYFSNATISEDAAYFINAIWPKLHRGITLKSAEIRKLETIYAFACR